MYLSHLNLSFPRVLFSSLMVLGFVLISSGPLYAAAQPQQSKTCKSGWVWSSSQGKCVKKTSEFLSDNDLFAAASQLVERGAYQQAQDLLYRIKNQRQPRVLNYIGYTTRKMGRTEDAIRYYKMALSINPDFVQARQYLGEGYLQLGKISSAKSELTEIEKRCGQSCIYFEKLAQQIAVH